MPNRFSGREDPRRAFLLKALAAGLLSGVPAAIPGALAQVLGRRPQRLPAGQSIYEVTGPVLVNGQPATSATRITATDRVETGKGARLIFVVGADAFVLRENSKLEMRGNNLVVNLFRLTTGAVLSAFGRGASKQLDTPTAALGIRGTGLYVESQPDQSYVCTCYGEVNIAAANDPSISERIVTKHHDAPRYVLGPGAARRIVPAGFINHSDVELMLIESLVGRTTPFSLFDQEYGAPRRY